MLPQGILKKYQYDPQGLAEYFLFHHFRNKERTYPVNPFGVLSELNIHFVFRDFKKLEGLFMPASYDSPLDLVVINSKRPITRQRFTAAHELCHYLKDANKQTLCLISDRAPDERYADAFASAFLMPKYELARQVDQRCSVGQDFSLDDVLYISDYFGVSFAACYYRISSLRPHLLPKYTKKELQKYKPDNKRKLYGLSYTPLLSSMFDAWDDISLNCPSEFAQQVFKNSYVFNDARLEGVDTTSEAVSEIVEDLLTQRQVSNYCSEMYNPFCHIAGHSSMYDYVFDHANDKTFDIYKLVPLNKQLFSCMPNPEYGGSIRRENSLVLGAKFETVDWHDIMNELVKLNAIVLELDNNYDSLQRSQLILEIARIHHRITVIHPFHDGNGRTSRAFLNVLLLRYGMIPIYVKTDWKEEYFRALEEADKTGNYEELQAFIMKLLIRSHVELALNEG